MSLRIRILSDLHTEFMCKLWPTFVAALPVECDVLVLAGDIAVGSALCEVLPAFCERFPQVVFVPGNHEYYGSSLYDVDLLLDAWEPPSNLHILRDSAVVIAGQRFVGCTLWFRYDPRAPNGMMSDFEQIEDLHRHVYERNRVSVEYLNANVRPGDVVVTHHLPSQRSVHAKYAGSSLNSFFVCDVEDIITSFRPAAWLHGHTHSSCDYVIEQTRVLCNPFGYYGNEINRDFDAGKTVEVGS